ncbi:MAG: ArnT family glycosyltransferase [Anaerolineae bacterium]
MFTTKALKTKVLFLFCLASMVRIAAALFLGSARVAWDYEYEVIATNLIEHGEYAYSFYGLGTLRPTSFIPPLYPLFLAGVRLLSASAPGGYKVLQIILSSLTIIVIYALTYEVTGKKTCGLLAALLATFYPPLVAYAVGISTVTFETFFLTAGLWAMLKAIKRPSLFAAGLAGLLLALAGLTRSTWLGLLPLVVVWIGGYPANLRRRSLTILALITTAGLILSPWFIRNYAVHGEFVLTSTNGGLNFWIGNHPQATGEYIFPTRIDQELVMRVVDWPEPQRDRFFYKQGLQFVRHHPDQFLGLLGKKLFYFLFFRPNIGSNYASAQIPFFEWVKIGFVLSWLVLLPFAFLGVLHGSIPRQQLVLLTMPLTISAVTSILYFVGTRFRTPVDSIVIIWASCGLLYLFERRRLRRKEKSREDSPSRS